MPARTSRTPRRSARGCRCRRKRSPTPRSARRRANPTPLLPKPAPSERTCCPRPGPARDRPDRRAIDTAVALRHTGAPGLDPTFLLTIRARLRSMGTLWLGPGRAAVFLTAKEYAVRRPIEVATMLGALLGAAAGNAYGQTAAERFVLSGVVVFDGGGGVAWLHEPTLTQSRVIALRPGESI